MRRTRGGKHEIGMQWFCFDSDQLSLDFRLNGNDEIIERGCEALTVEMCSEAVNCISLDEHGNSDYPYLCYDSVNQHLQSVATCIAKQVIQRKEDAIRELLTAALQSSNCGSMPCG